MLEKEELKQLEGKKKEGFLEDEERDRVEQLKALQQEDKELENKYFPFVEKERKVIDEYGITRKVSVYPEFYKLEWVVIDLQGELGKTQEKIRKMEFEGSEGAKMAEEKRKKYRETLEKQGLSLPEQEEEQFDLALLRRREEELKVALERKSSELEELRGEQAKAGTDAEEMARKVSGMTAKEHRKMVKKKASIRRH